MSLCILASIYIYRSLALKLYLSNCSQITCLINPSLCYLPTYPPSAANLKLQKQRALQMHVMF